MYRLLIVDDEPEIRLGLTLKIDAARLGLELAGEASNGLEALELLEQTPVDIVLTDMNMPLMDGVSFLEACRERHPDVRLVVITGYEDFRYARAALRHHAFDYLLKPVARDELAAVLASIAAELDGAREELEREARARWELSRYFKEMREHFVVRLIKGESDRESAVLDRAARFGMEPWARREARFLSVGLRPRADGDAPEAAAERTPDRFLLPFELLCREKEETSGAAVVAFRDANYPGLIHFATTEDEAWLRGFAAELDELARGMLGFGLALGAGRPVTGFGQWKEGYLSALLAWNWSESGAAEDERGPADGQAALSAEEISVIERCLARGDLASFERAARQSLQAAFAASRARFVRAIFRLYLLLEPLAHEARAPLGSAEQLWLRPEMALALDTVDRAAGFLAGIAGKIAAARRSEAADGDAPLMDAVLRHIGENYMSDLNLTQIAEKFNYNPSYFSELFKSKVGKTFIQYLTEARMAQAVRLLEGTQLGLWDIAELTGFASASYFSAKFKRMFGLSPSDYRQRGAGQGEPQEG
ncbi:response regulator [Paenibacillus sp. MWE-103]|uniref:Response regulator n=1 Tax=Paenibacillus artemisiicola TaxID=1172618 RepID=A0ABS3W6H6_9BACL|nr:response regulator [Paenibacillus artemisiicola]MBO7743740.1 response regulator [Paenibacillus artemisiicola]